MNKYSAITLFSLLFLLSSCLTTKPTYYEKEGQMHVKGEDFNFGNYDRVIEGADPSSFHQFNCYYTADANHVYYYEKTVENADPSTFVVLDKYIIGQDSLHVYYGSKLVPDADVKSFRFLKHGYERTDSLLFYCCKPVNGADPESVIIYNYRYIKDKNDVYLYREPLHVSDVNSFKFVKKWSTDYQWGVDKDSIYYIEYGRRRSTFSLVDEDSFKVIDEHWAKDKFYVYYGPDAVKSSLGDDSSLRVIDYNYAKNKEHVFYRGKIVEGADPKTFKVQGNGIGRDQYREFDLR